MRPPAPSLRHPPEAEPERQQIHAGLVAVCRDHGLCKATVEQVVMRSGLDCDAFTRHFADLDDCFADYLADACGPLFDGARMAVEGADRWRLQLRGAVYEIIRFLAADQDRAHMLLVETRAAGPRGSLVRDQAFEEMVDFIDRGRLLMDDPTALTRVTAEALAGALVRQLELLQTDAGLKAAAEVVPQLMYFLVLPYLGQRAAIEELSKPPPSEA